MQRLSLSASRSCCGTTAPTGGAAGTPRHCCGPLRLASCSPTWSAAPQRHQHTILQHGGTSSSSTLVCSARRGRRQGGRSAVEGDDEDDDAFSVYINGQRVSVSQSNLWMLALPAAMLLGLAALIGPLVIGITLTAVAIGAAASMGALALSFMWLPLAFFATTFFLFPFGAMATLGLGLLLPKILSLAIAAGGLGLGWWAVGRVLQPSTSTNSTSSSSSSFGSTSSSSSPFKAGKAGARGKAEQDGPVVQAESRSLGSEDEDEVRRMARELREFDSLLAEREEQRRVDEWRKNRTQ